MNEPRIGRGPITPWWVPLLLVLLIGVPIVTVLMLVRHNRVGADSVAVMTTPKGSTVVHSDHPADTTVVTPNAVVTTRTTVASAPLAPAEPGVVDKAALVSTPDPISLVGRTAQLNYVRVHRVVGDRTFWVHLDDTHQLLVRLDPILDKGKMEHRVVVRAGQTIDLRGDLERMLSRDEVARTWSLRRSQTADVVREPIYLHAISIYFHLPSP